MLTDIKARFALLKEKISKYWDFYLFFFIMISLIVLFFVGFLRYAWKRNNALYDKIMSIETYHNDNSISVPPDAEIYVIQPQGEQDVVIVGNPESIKVKPKNKK